MARKRKYTRIGEVSQGSECTNRKCKWQGTDDDKALAIRSGDSFSRLICPKCRNEEFYGLLEFKGDNGYV
jgi:hypothetical protein